MRTALLLLCVCVSGCDILGIGTATVDGEWILTARNLTDGSNICSIEGMDLSLTQTRDHFSGVASGATVSCTIGGTTQVYTLASLPIVEGRVDGDDVSFLIGGDDWKHTGRVESSSSMSGSIEVRFGPPIGTTRFVGSFGAARTDSVQLSLQRPTSR